MILILLINIITAYNILTRIINSKRVALNAINARRLPLALLVYILMTTSVGNNSVFRSFFEKQKLTGPNFIDWYRQLTFVPPEDLAANAVWGKGHKGSCCAHVVNHGNLKGGIKFNMNFLADCERISTLARQEEWVISVSIPRSKDEGLH
ncbi:hypothetical protein Tco_1217528 [Tanacetum coccineum]